MFYKLLTEYFYIKVWYPTQIAFSDGSSIKAKATFTPLEINRDLIDTSIALAQDHFNSFSL